MLGKEDRLVVDVDRNIFRVAYYRPRREKDRIVGEDRWAIKRKKLLDALDVVLLESESPHDPVTVEHYIRATSWGRQLP